MGFGDDHIQDLPRQLVKLILPPAALLTRSSSLLLPPALLDLTCSFQTPPFAETAVARLNLTTNSFQYHAADGTMGRIELPPRLRSFCTASRAEAILPILPNSINALTGVEVAVIDQIRFNWPESIRDLHVTVTYAERQTQPLLKNLTPNHRFSLSSATEIIPNMRTRGEEDLFRNRLPPNLTSLNLSVSDPMPLSWFIPHPRDPPSESNLSEVEKNPKPHPPPPSHPPSLTRLSLSVLEMFYAFEDLDDVDPEEFGWGDMFPPRWGQLLPPTLTYLYIDAPERVVNLEWLSDLVAPLKSLIIVRSVQIQASVFFKHIPCAHTLEELDVQFLPTQEPWKGVEMSNFVKLRRLTSYATKLPTLAQLPKRLTALRMPFLTSSDFPELYKNSATISLCRNEQQLESLFPTR
jgi:hypothetical protein